MFTFKGIHADTYKVVVNKLPPFKSPSVKTKVYNVDGYDGAIVESLGLQPYTLPVTITLMDLTHLDDVMAWLSGSGVLIRDEDDTKYLNVAIYNELEYEYLKKQKKTTFEFYVADPFRYVLDEPNLTLTAAGNVSYSGTYDGLPLLKITGSGVVQVSVGDFVFDYDFDGDTVVWVDSKIKETYNSVGLTNRRFTGEFPKLVNGNNAVSWTGTITEIIVTKRTRYI